MNEATATIEPAVRGIAVASAWPVARRLGLGSVVPGGRPMTRRLHDGVRLHEGDRVVDLWAGSGASGLQAGRVNLRSWTGVCPDARAAAAVARRVRGLDRSCVVGTPDATGLPDGQATVVLAEGLLTGLSDARKRAVLVEALRILRPGGRLGLHELCITPGAWGEPDAAAIRGEIGRAVAGGVRALDAAGWRALIEDAGLTLVGTSFGPVVLPDPLTLLREEGPRPGMEVMRRYMQPGRAGRRARAALTGVQRNIDRLASIVVIAERPAVAGRRHRWGT